MRLEPNVWIERIRTQVCLVEDGLPLAHTPTQSQRSSRRVSLKDSLQQRSRRQREHVKLQVDDNDDVILEDDDDEDGDGDESDNADDEDDS